MLSLNGIHNFSTLHFTFRERLLLANGLKFIPTPSSTLNATKKSRQLIRQQFTTYRDAIERQFNTLDGCYENNNQFIPKLHVKSSSHAPELHMFNTNTLVKNYTTSTNLLLEQRINDTQILTRAKMIRSNCTTQDRLFIQSLINNRAIVIKASDKNLGVSIVSTEWYNGQLKSMLSDSNTYERIKSIRYSGHSRLITQSQIDILTKPIYESIQSIMYRYSHIIEQFPCADQINKFIKRKVTMKKVIVPEIYLLIKVHKPQLCGRPIVPSKHWATTAPSILLDYLLQPLAKRIPWLVKDTKSLVNELEIQSIPLHQRNGILVTADISSLYTNIDTKLGIQLMQAFLDEQPNLTPGYTEFVIELLKIVMNNNYLQYNGTIYRQCNGTAMGTSVAPTYANIIVYMLERRLIERFSSYIYLYKRYLDDILLFIEASKYNEICTAFNSLHPSLIYDFTCNNTSIPFLDLVLYKGERFAATGRFDLKVHQKLLNKYLYIPFRSYHTIAMKKSFITTELKRYIRNSSSCSNYVTIKSLFYDRLRDRSYPVTFLNTIFNSIHYLDRSSLLLSHVLVNRTMLSSTSSSSRILSHSIGGSRMTFNSNHHQLLNGSNNIELQKLIFIINNDRLANVINIRQILLHYFENILNATEQSFLIQKPTIAYKSMPSLHQLLVNKKQRELSKVRSSTVTYSQDTINTFFTPRNSKKQ